MKTFLTILQLLWTAYSGSNLRRVVRARIGDEIRKRFDDLDPAVIEETEMDLGGGDACVCTCPASIPEPLNPSIPAPPVQAPQIIVPNPAHADRHGPASTIARAMERKGHLIEDKGLLNIVAIRSSKREFDVFGCQLAHFYLHNDLGWQLEQFPITTYPGKYYTVDKLLNPAGAAILTPGQNRGIYKLDKHRGIYEALCQRNGEVRVFRDGNRDRVYDLKPQTIQSGSFGINVHATQNPDGAPANLTASRVHAASAGCLVFARIVDFVRGRQDWRRDRLMARDRFTLTLIEDKDLDDPGAVPATPVKPQIDDNPAAWYPEGYSDKTGVRNRNLLNVKGDDSWLYSLGRDSRGHHIFPSFPKGLRAGIIDLRSKFTRRKLRTISSILAVWAPSSDTIGSLPGAPKNSPADYSRFVAGRMGIGANDTLMTFREDGQIRSPDQLFALVSAMVAYENGAGLVLPREVFNEALDLIS
jgi:hypothetical protein